MELVSVVMPAYNAAFYIGQAIASIQAQTYPHWELVVVDDGSTDATREVVQKLMKQDNRIEYVYQSNCRQGAARNNGIRHASGKYIAFLDADDLWQSNKLELQLEAIAATGVELVFSECVVFENDFELGRQYPLYDSCKGYVTAATNLDELLIRNRIPILTVLVTRTALERVGLFTQDLLLQNAEDYHLWMKLLLTGHELYGMSECLAAYRVHEKAMTGLSKSGLKEVLYAKYLLVQAFPIYKGKLRNDLARMVLHKFDSEVRAGRLPLEEVPNYLDFAGLKFFKPYFRLLGAVNASRTIVRSFYLLFRLKQF